MKKIFATVMALCITILTTSNIQKGHNNHSLSPSNTILNDTVELVSDSERDSIANFMIELYGLDQGIRNSDLKKRHPEIYTSVLQSIDSITFEHFISFVKRYGLPTREMMGDYYDLEAIQTLSGIIFLHNPHRLVEPETYDLLKRELAQNRIKPEALAIILDKYYVGYHNKTIYNSPFKAWTKHKGVLLSDKALSDSLLQDIGLTPLPDSVFVNE